MRGRFSNQSSDSEDSVPLDVFTTKAPSSDSDDSIPLGFISKLYNPSSDSDDGTPIGKITTYDPCSYSTLCNQALQTCDLCDDIFTTRFASIKHNLTHIIIPLLNLTVHQCDHCLFHFTSLDDLRTHATSKNHTTSQFPDMTSQIPDTTSEIPDCTSQISNKTSQFRDKTSHNELPRGVQNELLVKCPNNEESDSNKSKCNATIVQVYDVTSESESESDIDKIDLCDTDTDTEVTVSICEKVTGSPERNNDNLERYITNLRRELAYPDNAERGKSTLERENGNSEREKSTPEREKVIIERVITELKREHARAEREISNLRREHGIPRRKNRRITVFNSPRGICNPKRKHENSESESSSPERENGNLETEINYSRKKHGITSRGIGNPRREYDDLERVNANFSTPETETGNLRRKHSHSERENSSPERENNSPERDNSSPERENDNSERGFGKKGLRKDIHRPRGICNPRKKKVKIHSSSERESFSRERENASPQIDHGNPEREQDSPERENSTERDSSERDNSPERGDSPEGDDNTDTDNNPSESESGNLERENGNSETEERSSPFPSNFESSSPSRIEELSSPLEPIHSRIMFEDDYQDDDLFEPVDISTDISSTKNYVPNSFFFGNKICKDSPLNGAQDNACEEVYAPSVHYDELVEPQICDCRFCGRCFANRFDLIQHETTHMRARPKRPILCCVCERYLSGNHWTLRKHMQKHHPDSEPKRKIQQCKICRFSYHNYVKHSRYYHPSICKFCHKTFPPGKFHNCVDSCRSKLDSEFYLDCKVIKMCEMCLAFAKNKQNIHYDVIGEHCELGNRQQCDRCHNMCFEVSLVRRTVKSREIPRMGPMRKPITNQQRLRKMQNRLKMVNKMNKC